MSDHPVILGFDTSGPYCAAALTGHDGAIFTRDEPMKKGQAERLVPLLNELLTTAGYAWSDLDALAVGIGPGNFTGIRISISAVRGMALGLGVPVIPVSSFEIMRGPDTGDGAAMISLPTSRDMAFVQLFEGGNAVAEPQLIDPGADDLPDLRVPSGIPIRGHRAAEIAARMPGQHRATEAKVDDVPGTLIRIAAAKWISGQIDTSKPAPLYVRPADAAPPRDPAPVILP